MEAPYEAKSLDIYSTCQKRYCSRACRFISGAKFHKHNSHYRVRKDNARPADPADQGAADVHGQADLGRLSECALGQEGADGREGAEGRPLPKRTSSATGPSQKPATAPPGTSSTSSSADLLEGAGRLLHAAQPPVGDRALLPREVAQHPHTRQGAGLSNTANYSLTQFF